jgi:hypothetical protein
MPFLLFFLESKWSTHLIAAGLLVALFAVGEAHGRASPVRAPLLVVPAVLLTIEYLRRIPSFPQVWAATPRLDIDAPIWGGTIVAVIALSILMTLARSSSQEPRLDALWAFGALVLAAPVLLLVAWQSAPHAGEHLGALSPTFCEGELGQELETASSVAFTSPMAGLVVSCARGVVVVPSGGVWPQPTHVISPWAVAPGVGYPVEFLVPRDAVTAACAAESARACLARISP